MSIPPREQTAPAVLENIRDILADTDPELTDIDRVELISDASPEEFESWARP